MAESDYSLLSVLVDLQLFELEGNEREYCVAVNGKLISLKDASISVRDRGLMYGDGIYTTLKVSSGRALFIKRHINRLQRDLDRILFSSCVERFDLLNVIPKLIASNAIYDGYVRIQITRGSHMRFPDLEAQNPVCICLAGHLSPPPPNPISVITGDDPRDIYRDAKTINRIAALLALRGAATRNAQEVIFVEDGKVIEGTCHNVIAWTNEGLATPPLRGRGLPGIIRQVLLDSGIVALRDLSVSSVESMFITNCLVDVVPVAQINDRALKVDWSMCSEMISVIHRFSKNEA